MGYKEDLTVAIMMFLLFVDPMVTYILLTNLMGFAPDLLCDDILCHKNHITWLSSQSCQQM